MSNKLKVEFIDNSASQYDSNASEIEYGDNSKGGKLYLGDRFASSFVQLKFRNCRTVVSCCVDMHGFAKESDVNYLKIDPDDEKNDQKDDEKNQNMMRGVQKNQSNKKATNNHL